MSGIFPSGADGGVPPESATNGYDPSNPPVDTAALYYGNGCGVVLRPHVLNSLISEVACLTDKAGLNYDPGNPCNVFNAVIALLDSIQRNAPVYPEALTANGKLVVTAGAGQIVVGDNQSWRYRGYREVDADGIGLPQRTFTTLASAVYHLRWDAPGIAAPISTHPNGVIRLVWVADPIYNPFGKPETDPEFDSSYDSMLVARVVTNGANVPTVTTLINRTRIVEEFVKTTMSTGPSWPSLMGTQINQTIDWARTPALAIKNFSVDATTETESVAWISTSATRYLVNGFTAGYITEAPIPPNNFISGTLALVGTI